MLLALLGLCVLTAACAVSSIAMRHNWTWKVIFANPLMLCWAKPTRLLSLLKTRSTATLFL